MYALILDTYDYTNIQFGNDLPKMEKTYLEEVVDAKEDGETYVRGISLIEVKGPGNFQIGYGFDGDENVEVIRSWMANEEE